MVTIMQHAAAGFGVLLYLKILNNPVAKKFAVVCVFLQYKKINKLITDLAAYTTKSRCVIGTFTHIPLY
jgi:hypothetical protein